MRQILKIFKVSSIIIILTHGSVHSSQSPQNLSWETIALSQKAKDSLSDGPYAKSSITELSNDQQKLDYIIAGLHKKECSYALVKLSQYERYQEFVDFITESSYNNKSEKIRLKLSHSFLPFNMVLHFKIERITKTGTYRFLFDSGFLKGLTGLINISTYKNRCFFATTAIWQGPDTGIPNSVFSFFSQALGKMAMERLFRVSETL
jgi:hypothetical protein